MTRSQRAALIAEARKHHACSPAIEWLEANPKATPAQLAKRNPLLYLWAVGELSEFPANKQLLNGAVQADPGEAMAYCWDKLSDAQRAYCVKADPWTAMVYHWDSLTEEQQEYCKSQFGHQ